jgi:hypothetical protein
MLADTEKSENDNIETMNGEQDYEQFGLGQSLLQQEQTPSESGYTVCSSVDTTTLISHSSSPPDVPREENEQYEPAQ